MESPSWEHLVRQNNDERNVVNFLNAAWQTWYKIFGTLQKIKQDFYEAKVVIEEALDLFVKLILPNVNYRKMHLTNRN